MVRINGYRALNYIPSTELERNFILGSQTAGFRCTLRFSDLRLLLKKKSLSVKSVYLSVWQSMEVAYVLTNGLSFFLWVSGKKCNPLSPAGAPVPKFFVSQWFPTRTLCPRNAIAFCTQWIDNTFSLTFLWPWITKTQLVPRDKILKFQSGPLGAVCHVAVEGRLPLPHLWLLWPAGSAQDCERTIRGEPRVLKVSKGEGISPSPVSFPRSLLGLAISLEALTRVNNASPSTTAFPFRCCPPPLSKNEPTSEAQRRVTGAWCGPGGWERE